MITKELMMIRVCKLCAYVTGAAIILVMIMGSNPPRMPSFKGDIFDGFLELRLQRIDVDDLGVVGFTGEPFETLVNIHYISMVHRYEDFKETDHSCMIYFKDKEIPFLIRQEYKEVLSSIRRASGK